MPSRSESANPDPIARTIVEFFGGDLNAPVKPEDVERIQKLAMFEKKRNELLINRQVDRGYEASNPFRRAVDEVKKSESPIEEIMLLSMNTRSLLIGEFKQQFRVGPYRLDFGFKRVKLGVEVDGKAYHTAPADVKRDQKRGEYLATLGWTLVRFTGSQVRREPISCAMHVEQAYERLCAMQKLPEPWEMQ